MKPDDRVGQRFGKWTIISFDGYRYANKYYICKCECGTVKTVGFSNLCSGNSTQCTRCQHNQHTELAAQKRIKKYGVDLGTGYRPCKCGAAIQIHTLMCRKCRTKEQIGKPCKCKSGVTHPETLSTVGKRFGVTRERVRQVVKIHGWDGMMQYFNIRKCGL